MLECERPVNSCFVNVPFDIILLVVFLFAMFMLLLRVKLIEESRYFPSPYLRCFGFYSSLMIEQEAREGFWSQIKKLSSLERETSISINRCVDLGKTALHVAAEDDSLISHSSVPLPVDAFIDRLDDLSVGYCPHYSSSFKSSPESFLESIERYLFDEKVCLYLDVFAGSNLVQSQLVVYSKKRKTNK